MEYKTVNEGSVKLVVPAARIPEEGEVFYNPAMTFDRNVSVAAVALADIFVEKPKSRMHACDLLAASGVRAIRYAKESGLRVTANDVSTNAVKLIAENAKQNNATVRIKKMDGNALLVKEHFDVIDIDPFGSPINFIDNTVTSFSFKGMLAVTATDLGPLVGSYPEVCKRRYGIRSLFTDYNRELGIRILVTAIMRKFFQREKAFVPLFAYGRRHYFRIYGKVRYGNKNVNRAMKDFGYVSHCFECGWRACTLMLVCPSCSGRTEICGEIYLGELQDKQFCPMVSDELWRRGFSEEAAFVKTVGEELPFPFYYDTHYIAELLKASPPSIERVMAYLSAEGYRCGRTHLSGTAIKTHAGFEAVVRAVKEAAARPKV